MAANNGAINVGGIYADLEIDTGNLTKGLADGRQAMEAIGREIKTLQAEFKAGSVAAADYVARVAELNRTQTELASKMRDAHAALGVHTNALDIYNRQTGVATGQAAAFGRGMMQLGYVVDDVQYGFQAIVNNIGPLGQSFAAAAGASTLASNQIGAGLQVAAVGAYQLYVHWDQLNDAIGMGRVRTEAEAMEELGKQTKKTADETERLTKYKREQNQILEMGRARPQAEVEKAKAVGDAITEADYDKVLKGVFETLHGDPARRSKLTPDELGKINAFHKEDLSTDQDTGITSVNKGKKAQRVANEIEVATTLQDMKRSKELLRDATDDPSKLDELKALVGRSPGAFPEGFRESLDKNPKEEAKEKQKEQENEHKKRTYKAEKAAEARELIPNIDKDTEEAIFQDKKTGGKNKIPIWQQLTKKLEAAGMTSGAANAANTLTNDADKAVNKNFEDRKEKEAKEKATLEKKARKANVEDAEKRIPGFKAETEDAVIRAKVEGLPMDVVKKSIMESLEATGKNKKDAAWAAEDAVNEAEGDVNDKVAKKRIKQDERMEIRRSEIFGTSDLTSKIQGSIQNGDESKKHTDLQTKMVDYLAKITDRPGLVIGVKS